MYLLVCIVVVAVSVFFFFFLPMLMTMMLLLTFCLLLLFRSFSLSLFIVVLFLERSHKHGICAHNFRFLFRDLNKVEEGIGHKIGMLLQAIATSLVGFIMGFVYGWKLTLVMIAASPLVVIAGGIIGKVTS